MHSLCRTVVSRCAPTWYAFTVSHCGTNLVCIHCVALLCRTVHQLGMHSLCRTVAPTWFASTVPHCCVTLWRVTTPTPTRETISNLRIPHVRLAWSSYSMSFFDSHNVRLEYSGLDPAKLYAADVVMNAMQEPSNAAAKAATVPAVDQSARGSGARHSQKPVDHGMAGPAPPSDSGGGADATVRHVVRSDADSGYGTFQLLVGGTHQVWPPRPLRFALPPSPMAKTRVAIPHNATASGGLELSCGQPFGIRGNGRTCQIAEVWLVVVGTADAL
jgi:hypothetical protein